MKRMRGLSDAIRFQHYLYGLFIIMITLARSLFDYS